jgi:hypothetical protein
MSRPRAADDSAVICARLEELGRERGQVSVEPAVGPTDARIYSPARGETKHNVHPQIIRAWLILAIVNLVVILLLAVLAAVIYYRILDRAVLFFAQLLHGLVSES